MGTMETVLTALKAIAEPTRLRLLLLLEQNELTVSELTHILGQSQPRVSRHLKLMAEAGLIERFSEGTWAFFRLAETSPIASLVRELVDLLPEEDDTLVRDHERLEQVKQGRAEQAATYFSENAGRWDEIRSLHSPDTDVEAVMQELVGKHQIGTLLDIGTGTGRMLTLFAERIHKGIGIDLSREMLSVARANLDAEGLGHCQVRQGDMYNLSLSNGAADLVIFHHVLHFADDPAAAVQEASRTLGAGGRIVIVDFAPHALEVLRTEHAHRRLGFSEDEVSGWFHAAGLEEQACRHLEGKELTVTIWLAEKEGARQEAPKVEQEKRP
jgi:ubiquinone/menaquinone biosynthesis C-methylase UbiE/DNA-binding transcriptional ArsR family regulator